MKSLLIIGFAAVATPLLTFAQAANTTGSGGQQNLQGFIQNFVLFLNGTIVPLLLALAFLFFVINVMRFFVFQASNEDGQKAAKSLATYSVLAFVIILIFWGLVNLLTSTLGLTTSGTPQSDYQFQNIQPGTGNCTALQRDFDNEFGGPCATSNPPANSGVPNNPPGTSPNNPSSANPQQQGSFTPPSDDRPINPPPISDELEGLPEDDGIFGGPGRANL
jgi:hypothetical protein